MNSAKYIIVPSFFKLDVSRLNFSFLTSLLLQQIEINYLRWPAWMEFLSIKAALKN